MLKRIKMIYNNHEHNMKFNSSNDDKDVNFFIKVFDAECIRYNNSIFVPDMSDNMNRLSSIGFTTIDPAKDKRKVSPFPVLYNDELNIHLFIVKAEHWITLNHTIHIMNQLRTSAISEFNAIGVIFAGLLQYNKKQVGSSNAE